MQKGFARVFILIGVLVVGLGFVGAWYTKIIQIPNFPPPGCYYQQVQCIQAPCNPVLVCGTPSPNPVATLQATPSPTSSVSPAPNSADETANWKTYTSAKYGFSFQYPSNWYVQDYKEKLSGSDDIYIEFFENGTKPIEGEGAGTMNYMITLALGSNDKTFENQKLGINDAEDLLIGGRKAFKYPSGYFLEGWEYRILLDSTKNKILYFQTRTAQSINDQILSTFKFVYENSPCPTGYTYAKGGLQGDSAPYYCARTIKSPNGFTSTEIIPMSPYPTKTK